MDAFELQLRDAMARRQAGMQDAQSFQMPQGRMVGGHYIPPSLGDAVIQGLRTYTGQKQYEQAGQEIEQIGQKRQQALSRALRQFGQQAMGTPAETLPEGVEGPTRPGVAPNMRGAYSALLEAPDAALRQAGMQGMVSLGQEDAKRAQQQSMLRILQLAPSPQAAIASGVPADMVKSYYEARNLGRDKVTFQDVGGEKIPVTEYGDRPQGIAPLSKTGNPFSDLVIRDPQTGQMIPNQALVGAKSGIARAGASNVSVNMPDKKFYEGLGKSVSEQIESGFTQAQSAAQTLANANQIAAGLDKAIVGPLANQRVTVMQLGQALGVTGKDATEVLQNTRNVIQGLARQELSAAGQMKGQGQITESERGILRRAEAGQINDFTKPELETFINAIRKTARARIANHQRNLQRLGQDPQAQGMINYLQLEVPEDMPIGGQAQPQGMPQGFRVVRPQ